MNVIIRVGGQEPKIAAGKGNNSELISKKTSSGGRSGDEKSAAVGKPQRFQVDAILCDGHLLGLTAGGIHGKEPAEIGATHYRNIVYQDPKWDWHSLDLDKSVARADDLDNGTINATDPNLKPFFSHGGKLLMYHGWADPLIASENSINYYESVMAATGGEKKASSSIRLFMAPGMDHCFGGAGPNVSDAMEVIEHWVENGKAPDQIIASHMKGATPDRTRPLCPYPQVARYKGSGSIDEAGSFACAQ